MVVTREVKLSEKMVQMWRSFQRASLKRIPQGEKMVHGKSRRSPGWVKRINKTTATALDEDMDEREQELAAPTPTCPRVPLCRMSLGISTLMLSPSLWTYFCEHFDRDGWSLWSSEFCFPEELTEILWVVSSTQKCTRDWTNGEMSSIVQSSLDPKPADQFLVFRITETKSLPLL